MRTPASHRRSNPAALGHARRLVETADVVASFARVDKLNAELVKASSTVAMVAGCRWTIVACLLYDWRLTALGCSQRVQTILYDMITK